MSVGDVVNNLASIYFDYNLPVATNNAVTLVQNDFGALPIQLSSFTGQLNSNTVQLNWKAGQGSNFEKFEIERSTDGKNYSRVGAILFNNSVSNYTAQDNISAIQSKQLFYRLRLVDSDGKIAYSRVVVFNINPAQNDFLIYPNPAMTEIFVSLNAIKKDNLTLRILDASGRIIAEERQEIQKGNSVFPINTSDLKAGNYILDLISESETKALRFTIMK